MFKASDDYVNRLSVEQLRAEVHDFAGRWVELTVAMQELPELPSPELLHVLGDFAVWSDHARGKQMQRKYSVEQIPPVSECEGGAGVWAIVRAALIEARRTSANQQDQP